ncbi:DNA-directed RNA polymerase I subunit RPA34.5-domain-containing protein [Microdochium bolleyi]|uniref:DNA-directed RNA polymerase I subunit RPA34.5-domain-containing protein n=1 Tax=Microdochium bolleyi TaxID=196109 RepID=A0A136J0N7_9PEZI|nr:DNA-directed RNA polymerase I subunit RPA34.5-domain-containing protein [Microdochium bolleyi]
MAPRAKVASLTSMAAAVKDQKKGTASGFHASIDQAKKSLAAQAKDDSDSSNSSSESDGSGSGSDSDVELDLEAERKKLAAKTAGKPKPAAAVNGSKPTAPAASKPAAAAKKVEADSSSEEETDSSDESDSETKRPTKPAPVTSRPAQKTTSDSSSSGTSSEEESDSEDEEDVGAKVPSKPAQAPAKAVSAPKPNGPAQEESSEEESGSEADSESEEDEAGTGKAVSKANEAAGTTVSRPGWLDSTNFTIRKANSADPGKEVADFLNTANLEGKQVWYFTAPASLPITVLQELEIDLADAQSGRAILQHGGDAYGIDLESQAVNSQVQLFIPTKTGDQYHGIKRSIDSAVHIRRQVKFGPDGGESATATDNYAIKPRAVRQQPQGLRPRFTPIGVPRQPVAAVAPLVQKRSAPASDDESESSSDEEMADAPASSAPSLPAATVKRKPATSAAAKRLKSSQAASTPVPSSQISLGAGKNETPVPPPSVGGTSIAASTPSKTKKEKKPKATASKPESTVKIPATQTPVPAPSMPFRKP